MIDVVYLSYKDNVPADDYWDHGLLHDLFSHKLWRPAGGFEFNQIKSDKGLGLAALPFTDGAVIVFPARNQIDALDQLNNDLKRLKWAILILTGDEANEFPAHMITHPNIKLWIMSANPHKHVKGARKIGSGYPPQAKEWLPKYETEATTKPLDYYFAGQITHERRQMLGVALETMLEHYVNNKLEGEFHFTQGFTQGVEPSEYYLKLASSKTAPCSSGPESPDSFRLYEALEAGSVPVVDAFSPQLQDEEYWTWFFDGEPPFPVFTDYETMRGYIKEAVDQTPRLANKVFAWWQAKKREMSHWLVDDIKSLNPHLVQESQGLADDVTIIMPSSPIKSHPSTEMIEKTIADVRIHLPDSEIIITIDGIRDEQQDYSERYEEYKRRLLWKCNHEWQNVIPVVFDEHMHQAKMAKAMLSMVKTPTILYVEHDTPLTPDRPIEWTKLIRCITDGTANIVRFYHESNIVEEHKHLMIGDIEQPHGVAMLKTQQWSQRPHLASTAFYKHMLDTYFHPSSLTMIEDVMHQVVEMDMHSNGSQAWFNWRIWIYAPQTDGDGWILRSYNQDGRGDDPKYDMQILPVERK